jgi:hypothetical protein
MTCASAVSSRAALPGAATRLSPAASFYLLASITVSLLAGSSAPTPLYPLYQAEWGLTSMTVTEIFGVYAFAVLSALLVAGRLSDYVGRRPVLVAATLAQAVTMAVFAMVDGAGGLMIARVLQGLSTGAAVAAVGAGLIDLDKVRGTTANAIAPMLGTASGAILAGLLVRYLPAPTHLVYLVLGAVFVLQAGGLVLMGDSVTPRPGALASLKPQFGVPRAVRDPLLRAVPALVATWALAGFYGSLGPTMVRHILGANASLLGGLALFVLAGSGAVAVLVLHRQPARTMMSFGAAALFAGVAITVAGVSYHSIGAFFLGTVLGGIGFGAGFQGAVRTVVPFAAPHERAGVLAVIFVVCYVAMGAPAMMAGFLLVKGGNVFATASTFGALVMGLAALALLGAMSVRAK